MQQPQAYNWTELNVNQGQWQFVEGGWSQGVADVIMPPYDLGDLNLAVCTDSAYQDFEASFEFRWDVGVTNAGFVFRARDARHYYMLHFPVVGQHYRIEHFWGAISKVDESGFAKVVGNGKMEMIGGVPSEIGLWHKVRLVVKGSEIRAWIDGRPLAPVTDDTYSGPGYVGLSTYASLRAGAKSSFRNVRIRGKSAAGPAWDASVQPARNWFRVSDAGGMGCGSIVRAPNKDLLVTIGKGIALDDRKQILTGRRVGFFL